MPLPLEQSKYKVHQGGLIALLAPLAADVKCRDAAPEVLQQLQDQTCAVSDEFRAESHALHRMV